MLFFFNDICNIILLLFIVFMILFNVVCLELVLDVYFVRIYENFFLNIFVLIIIGYDNVMG